MSDEIHRQTSNPFEQATKTLSGLLGFSPEDPRVLEYQANKELSAERKTVNAMAAMFGLSQADADAAYEASYGLLPRDRPHYEVRDRNYNVEAGTSLNIDQVEAILKAEGVSYDEEALRKGVILPSGRFIKDVYSRGALKHEPKKG